MSEENRPQVYTVTELTRDIRMVFENTFQSVWVEGEVSNYIASSAGHSYFSLKDENSVLKCVLFKQAFLKINFDIKNGMHILCRGKISVYDKRGEYQLYVAQVEPKGKGALQLAFEQLKEKLNKEGLFDEERKRPLPRIPLRIGVVTSPTGAAIKDILKVAKRRYANIEITLRGVLVQGDKAKYEIKDGIEELNEYNEYITSNNLDEHPIDVIIVGRGGGSLEDLWPFNEEIVARAIFDSKIPVISAVGHEIDYTISDFVADLRAPTPSAAAELVIPSKKDLKERIEELKYRLTSEINEKINILQERTVALKDRYVLKAPLNFVLQSEQRIDDLTKILSTNFNHKIEIKNNELKTAAEKLEMLSPLGVLKRGYSITFKEGTLVRGKSDVVIGDLINTKLAVGGILSRVENMSD